MATISFKQPKATGVPSRSSSRLDQSRACRTPAQLLATAVFPERCVRVGVRCSATSRSRKKLHQLTTLPFAGLRPIPDSHATFLPALRKSCFAFGVQLDTSRPLKGRRRNRAGPVPEPCDLLPESWSTAVFFKQATSEHVWQEYGQNAPFCRLGGHVPERLTAIRFDPSPPHCTR